MLALPATAALAQQVQTPASARVTEIDAIADLLFDSNVARSDLPTAVQRRLKLSDEIISPGVNFSFARPFGPETFFVNGSAKYLFHRVNTILDRENIDVGGGFTGRLARCQETATGEYAIHQSDLSEIGVGVVSNTLAVTSVGGSVACGRPTGFGANASVMQNWRRNSAPLLTQVDSNSLAVQGSLVYQRP